jgi:hypothetical protein
MLLSYAWMEYFAVSVYFYFTLTLINLAFQLTIAFYFLSRCWDFSKITSLQFIFNPCNSGWYVAVVQKYRLVVVLLFWIILSYLPFLATNVYLQVLMRDLLSKPKNSTHSAADSSAANGSGSENAKKKTLSFVNDDFCGAMLDTSFPRMLKREKILPGTALSLGALELWSDDFEDKSKFSQYRSRLVCLIGI